MKKIILALFFIFSIISCKEEGKAIKRNIYDNNIILGGAIYRDECFDIYDEKGKKIFYKCNDKLYREIPSDLCDTIPIVAKGIVRYRTVLSYKGKVKIDTNLWCNGVGAYMSISVPYSQSHDTSIWNVSGFSDDSLWHLKRNIKSDCSPQTILNPD